MNTEQQLSHLNQVVSIINLQDGIVAQVRAVEQESWFNSVHTKTVIEFSINGIVVDIGRFKAEQSRSTGWRSERTGRWRFSARSYGYRGYRAAEASKSYLVKKDGAMDYANMAARFYRQWKYEQDRTKTRETQDKNIGAVAKVLAVVGIVTNATVVASENEKLPVAVTYHGHLTREQAFEFLRLVQKFGKANESEEA